MYTVCPLHTYTVAFISISIIIIMIICGMHSLCISCFDRFMIVSLLTAIVITVNIRDAIVVIVLIIFVIVLVKYWNIVYNWCSVQVVCAWSWCVNNLLIGFAMSMLCCKLSCVVFCIVNVSLSIAWLAMVIRLLVL